eukprot:CAMPEP_0201916310 /NCGR_PEP_ID=MMETSP0903-20130614/5971_1 /ASSEMBLY_ACC=CAM_ASM_000552 /TAXON_ID=420261 /ORGANISM="Thalassiosira antarctica, Strain CCMP982" /LENGTH=70 /DNA_ID=CAMNT_0048452085 /DNA_START=269 /DNA_END=482 /DNA_ORIENTATION=-
MRATIAESRGLSGSAVVHMGGGGGEGAPDQGNPKGDSDGGEGAPDQANPMSGSTGGEGGGLELEGDCRRR